MAFGSEPQNPVFKVLADIQRYTDVCPNPEESDFSTCRAMRKDGGRCRNPPCTQYERHHSHDLMFEFRGMTECPDTDSFYNKLETFITYSHCKRWHRWPALAAFERWKKERIAARSNARQRFTPARAVVPPARPSTPPPAIQPTTTTVIQPLTAAALQQLPTIPTTFVPSAASATSDGGDSFDNSILETRSVASNGSTFLSSLPNTPPRNGLVSGMEIDDIAEEDGADWTADNVARMPDLTLTSGVNDTAVTEKNDSARETAVDELGIIRLQRNGSLRDHSRVFQVISSHPTANEMSEGVVYIFEDNDNPSLFKIGWSSESAEETLKQPNNCYGVNTRVVYETQRFAGAPHAEKLARVILQHANIRVLSCEKCKGGHTEWFSAQAETIRQTVIQVEHFVQMPAYTLQDGEYKLSPEAYSRVVKQMCDFSIDKMGELMHKNPEGNKATKSTLVLCESISVAPLTPPDTPRPSTKDIFFETQDANGSLVSLSTQTSGKTRLSTGTKVARKLKHFVTAKNTVKEYLTRSRGSTPEVESSEKRAFGAVFVDLKGKARGLGTKAREDVRGFRRDFKEELRRNGDEAE
ncbi:hypothetical protein TRIATDRAFT_145580 [Trichoderma atroviride IMI 206040]|uniref:Bacteriophage T5 Orf172 DNA-binding domain-containing protein n=1 Tax=Hypocrea atroviridis (strain ATCC 20476 / IMI 206040) TaxID=452589 RepID=G9NLI3_HYPAI|nr:uncharacterized protein TRIATDRAFT_145580 [Trichoderma atroviride IMI 206040]EHK48745.1 hypothetical protein TRIATDRAFT_145580 [Trichoderma atroviride IMI 206040]